MFKKLLIKEHKKKLSNNQFLELKKLIHEENPLTVIASFNDVLLKEYLNECILSNLIYLFSCNIKKKIIGYAIFARKPYYLFSEISYLKFKILKSLIFNFKFIAILNLVLKYFNLENLLISKRNKLIIKNNLNLNLLAISDKQQSQGIGTIFLKKLINKLNKKKNYNLLGLKLKKQKQKKFFFKRMYVSPLIINIKERF